VAEPFVPPVSTGGVGYVRLRDLAASGAIIALATGFLRDDPTNVYQGKPSPRYIVSGRNLTEDNDVTISSPKLTGNGEVNSRTEFLEALDKHFAGNPEAVIAVRFTETPGSAYVGLEVAEQ